MFADEGLAQRLHEKNREFFSGVEGAARDSGVVVGDPYLDLGSTIAFFAGDGSPMTQASGKFEADQLPAIEEFFRGRASSWEAIVTPFSGADALNRLLEIGAKAEAWESVLYRPVSDPSPDWQTPEAVVVEEIGPEKNELWSSLSKRGFFGDEPSPIAEVLSQIFAASRNMRRYIAYVGDEPGGTGSLTVGSGIGFLTGMSTLPEFRGRGLQTAVIQRRLKDVGTDCDVVVIGASPGTTSHRNCERCGFKIAFSQLSLRVS